MKNFKFYLLLALIALVSLSLISCGSSSKTDSNISTTSFAVLLSQTNNQTEISKNMTAAIETAKDDVNAYLESIGSTVRINLVIKDAGDTSTTLLDKIKELKALGIKFIIGPETSGELAEIKDYVAQNDIIILSPSSTAPSLAIANDNVYRFAPTDVLQANALTQKMNDTGVKSIIVLYRDDVWGNDLKEEIQKVLVSYNITLVDAISYDTVAPNFTTIASTLNEKVTNTQTFYPANEIGVVLLSFQEVKDIFIAANSYAALQNVKWFGCENVLLENVRSNAIAAGFARSSKFLGTMYISPATANDTSFSPDTYLASVETIKTNIYSKLAAGQPVNDYSLIAYDVVWLAALAQHNAGTSPSLNTLKSKLIEQTNNYTGVNGQLLLNQFGDRITGGYGYYEIQQIAGADTWILNSVYKKYSQNSPNNSSRAHAAQTSITPVSSDSYILVETMTLKNTDFKNKYWWNYYYSSWAEMLDNKGVLNQPTGVSTDDTGNIYVADAGNQRIVKYSKDGRPLKEWGVRGIGDNMFLYPFSIAIDNDSAVCYVIDRDNAYIQKYDLEGNFIERWGAWGTSDTYFNQPTHIYVDQTTHNIYIIDSLNHRLLAFNSNGDSIGSFGYWGYTDQNNLNYPTGVTGKSGSDSYIYVFDRGNYKIKMLDNSLNFIKTWGGQGNGNNQFLNPKAIALNDTLIYALDDYSVQIFNETGIFQYKLNAYGKFKSPQSIFVDKSKNIYIANTGNNSISIYRLFAENEILRINYDTEIFRVTVDKQNGWIYTGFSKWSNVDEDYMGYSYITQYDSNMNFIRNIGYDGSTPNANNQFNSMRTIIAYNGNLYVLDSSKNQIIKYNGSNPASNVVWDLKTITNDNNNNFRFSAINCDSAGNVYVSIMDRSNNQLKIAIIRPSGTLINLITESVTHPDNHYGYGGRQIAVNDSGFIYVGDYEKIHIFNPALEKTGEIGGYGSVLGSFMWISDIQFNNGYLYVADEDLSRISQFDSNGNYIRYWGTSGLGHLQFLWPCSLSLDADNNIYVVDCLSLQKFRP